MDSGSTVSLHFGLLALAALSAGCNNAPVNAPGDTGAAADGPAETADGGPATDGPAAPVDSETAAGGSCSPDKPCPGALFCDLDPALSEGGCGKRNVSGTCVDRPATCPAGGAPVCGCDGVTYQSDCLRQKAGVPLSSTGACQGWEKGPISCGAMTCGPSQVCVQPGSRCGLPPPCMPAPDGGTCPTGLVGCTDFTTHRPGCMYSCAPPPPYCLDVPASCRGLPTCSCLQPANCYCEGIQMGRVVVCLGAA